MSISKQYTVSYVLNGDQKSQVVDSEGYLSVYEAYAHILKDVVGAEPPVEDVEGEEGKEERLIEFAKQHGLTSVAVKDNDGKGEVDIS